MKELINKKELECGLDWLKKICKKKKVYGMPKNGLILALLANLNIVSSIKEADIILDDVIENGNTLRPFIKTKKQLVTLYTKPWSPFKERLVYFQEKNNWLEFWWEKEYDNNKKLSKKYENQ